MFEGSTLETGTDIGRQIQAEALRLCREFGYAEAEKRLAEAIRSDPQWIEWSSWSTARREVRLTMTSDRGRIEGVEEAPDSRRSGPKVYADATQRRVEVLGGKYLAWPLSSQKLLADATLEDVRAEAEMYESLSAGNARRGRFMRLVERRLITLKIKPGETVGKVLDESTLGRLMTKAAAA